MLSASIWDTVICEMATSASTWPTAPATVATVAAASRNDGEVLILKNIRWAESRAAATSPGRVRSPTTTSAPSGRSSSAGSSPPWWTIARTRQPRSRRNATTLLPTPTPPCAPPAPVTRMRPGSVIVGLLRYLLHFRLGWVWSSEGSAPHGGVPDPFQGGQRGHEEVLAAAQYVERRDVVDAAPDRVVRDREGRRVLLQELHRGHGFGTDEEE